MSADAALWSVFVEAATRYLALPEQANNDDETQREARESLGQAAELLDDEMRARAKKVVQTLCADWAKGIESLRQLVDELRDKMTPRSSGALNSSDYDMLRSFFRDEARQTLDSLTQELMGSRPVGFDEPTFREVMRQTHTLKGSAATVRQNDFADAAHQLEEAFDEARRRPWSAQIAEIFVDAIDGMREHVNSETEAERRTALDRVQSALSALSGAPAEKEYVRTRPIIARKSTESERRVGDRRAHVRTLRVDPARIDHLMDGVGELLFDRTRIGRRTRQLRLLAADLTQTRRKLHNEIAGLEGDSEALAERLAQIEENVAHNVALINRATASLSGDVEALKRTAAALQDGLAKVRMQSVRSLFQMLAPRLRAIARDANKRVRLETSGGETEFDKAVVEQIIDPLIQLLRNAVAHGIESSDARQATGKPEEGLVSLTARHEGDLVVLEVSDDGAGIDPDGLRRRFVASGRWSEARAKLATDDDVMRMIFTAGVSTRDKADRLAGRGFGLDAVRETIAQLGGEIRVKSSPGHGTTFTLRLPLTAAISNAMLFKVGDDVYAVPNVHVVETTDIETTSSTLPSHIHVHDQSVPLVLLHSVLGSQISHDARSISVVVIEYLGKRLATTCDKIVGPREIVLKTLGPLLSPLPLYAGGTISGSGKVQLILDPAALVRLAYPTLPAAEPAQDFESVTAPSTALPNRILVADDSLAVREAMTLMLERAGHIVDAATDGAEAWAMLHEFAYDILVTDLEMPGLDGFGLIEQLRHDGALAELPVIIISSRTSKENRDRAKALGVTTFLAKPVTQKRLARALDELA